MRTSHRSLFVALSLQVALATGCERAHGEVPVAVTSKSQQVRTRAVVVEPMAPSLHATGRLLAREQATLSFNVGGRVNRILVRAGDRVRQGQVLATLDTREFDARVEQATLALQKATRDEVRARALHANRAVMQQVLDDAMTASRHAYQAVALARLERGHTTLVAPESGIVARRMAEPGMVVGPGVGVLQLNLLASGYTVQVSLIDRDFVRVEKGDKAVVRFDAFEGRTFSGAVVELAEEPSPLTGVYDAQIKLDTEPPRILGGLVAKVEIVARDPERLAVVPIEAIVDGIDRTAAVYVVDSNKRAHRRAIETALLGDGKVGVRSGLVAGELVVSEGAAFLRDGALVRVVDP